MSPRNPTYAREKILEAAYELFYAQGYQATTVDEVIERSGVSKPTVYSHFPTKEALCVAYLQERRRREIELLKQALRRAKTPKARFMAVAEHIRERVLASKYRGCGFFNMVCEIPDADNPIVAEAKIYIDAARETIRDVVRDLQQSDPKFKHIKPDELADSYYLIIAGAIMASQEYRDPWPVNRAVKDVAKLLER